MSSAVQQKTTKTYTYRSGAAGGNTDVSIEYSADLSALSRLEVRTIERKGIGGKSKVEKKLCQRKKSYENMVQCARKIIIQLKKREKILKKKS